MRFDKTSATCRKNSMSEILKIHVMYSLSEMSDLASIWARLTTNGTNLGLLIISILFILTPCAEINLWKSEICPIWCPFVFLNLTFLFATFVSVVMFCATELISVLKCYVRTDWITSTRVVILTLHWARLVENNKSCSLNITWSVSFGSVIQYVFKTKLTKKVL